MWYQPSQGLSPPPPTVWYPQVYLYPNIWWPDSSEGGVLSSVASHPSLWGPHKIWRLHSLYAKFIRGPLHIALELVVHAVRSSQWITSHSVDREPQPLQWIALVTPNVPKPGFHSQAFKSKINNSFYSAIALFVRIFLLYLCTPSLWTSYTPLKTLGSLLVCLWCWKWRQDILRLPPET